MNKLRKTLANWAFGLAKWLWPEQEQTKKTKK
jgi:hypothetical protein